VELTFNIINTILLSLICFICYYFYDLEKQKKKEKELNEFIENFVTQEDSVISDHVLEREKEYDKLIAGLKQELYNTDEAMPIKGMTYNIPHDEVDKKIIAEKYPDIEYAE
jgi:cell division protein FtsX